MTTTRGLVALGDSITNGHGEPALGVHPQSWAQWLAEALELPFTKLAVDGAQAADVLREQVPRLRGPYDVACVYAGVNDVRGLDFDAAAYERDLRAIAAAARAASARLVLCTLPEDLGRPRAAPKPAQASAIVRRLATETGAGVVALDDLAGRAVAPARRRPPHRRRATRDRRPRGARPRRPAAALGDRRGPPLAPRPRALRGPPWGPARRRPAPARGGADHPAGLRG